MKRAVLFAALTACCPALTPARQATAPAPSPDVVPEEPAQGLDWAAAGIDWTQPPAPWPEAAFTPPLPQSFRLPNGVEVHLIENHRLPLVSVRVVHGAAGTREDGASAGLASLTAEVLDQGAGTRSATELPEELERLGARLSVGARGDHATLTLDTLADTLEPSLAIAADVIQRPRLAAADFDRVKAERLADLALRADSPRAVAGLVFERLVFGDHPYGSPGAGWIETVTRLTLADVKRFWATHYGPSETRVIVAGAVTRAQLDPILTRTFGAWKGKARPRKLPAEPILSPQVIAFVDRPGAAQSVVTIGGVGPRTYDTGNREALDVVTTAVGGSFASRLNTRLREQLGYTYSIYANTWRGRWSGAWSATSAIRTDVTAPAIKEVLAILAATAETPMPDDELARAKGLISLALPQNFETNGAIASAYATLIVEDRPLDSYRELGGVVDRVTADQAADAARRWWGRPVIVVVGDWAAIGDEVAKLGLPIVRYSADGRIL